MSIAEKTLKKLKNKLLKFAKMVFFEKVIKERVFRGKSIELLKLSIKFVLQFINLVKKVYNIFRFISEISRRGHS